MRGYRTLKEGGNLARLANVREAITNTRLAGCGAGASRFFFGAAIDNAELAVRQYLLRRVIQPTWLYRSLLYAIGTLRPVVHPLPSEWREVLRKEGFTVAEVRSAVVWNAYVGLLFAYGVVWIARDVWRSSWSIVRRRVDHASGRWVFFVGLTSANLPQRDGSGHDIVTWYRKWPGRCQPLDALCHSAKDTRPRSCLSTRVLRLDSPIPPLRVTRAWMKFVGWCAAAIALGFVDLLRGRWWHALLLGEACAAAMARLQVPATLAREYLFHNSDALFRPLWTYEAEAKGSLITFYFYSTNNETFKRPDGYPTQAGSWEAMSWSRYLVWNDYQAAFVRRAVGDRGNVIVVGPIWFSEGERAAPSLPPGCIAVFDVQPCRPSLYQTLGLPHEFYTPKTANQFLRDVHSVASQERRSIAFKRKRQVGRLLHRSYASKVAQLANSGTWIDINPDISAVRVIDRCVATISMPFTSTALIARDRGKPSVYYDPHGFIQKDERAAHGVPILAGVAELQKWLATLDASIPFCATDVSESPVYETRDMTMNIITERFYLRELTLDDVTDEYLQWLRDPEAKKYITASLETRTLADLRAYVAARAGRADVLFLGIFDKRTGTHVGNLKYEPIDREHGYAVMGILIGPTYRGKGVGPEVLVASARWLRDQCAINQVILTVRHDHTRAIRAYTAAGFKQENTQYLVPQHAQLSTMVLKL